jgi:diguanylate cyclase (GGDEF)-like protein
MVRARPRQDSCASAVVADIDGFKQINDSFSHVTGDVVLRHGSVIRGNLRDMDASRLGRRVRAAVPTARAARRAP